MLQTRQAEDQTPYESPNLREACTAALKLDVLPQHTRRVKNAAMQLLYKLLDEFEVGSTQELSRLVGLFLALLQLPNMYEFAERYMDTCDLDQFDVVYKAVAQHREKNKAVPLAK